VRVVHFWVEIDGLIYRYSGVDTLLYFQYINYSFEAYTVSQSSIEPSSAVDFNSPLYYSFLPYNNIVVLMQAALYMLNIFLLDSNK